VLACLETISKYVPMSGGDGGEKIKAIGTISYMLIPLKEGDKGV